MVRFHELCSCEESGSRANDKAGYRIRAHGSNEAHERLCPRMQGHYQCRSKEGTAVRRSCGGGGRISAYNAGCVPRRLSNDYDTVHILGEAHLYAHHERGRAGICSKEGNRPGCATSDSDYAGQEGGNTNSPYEV